MANYIFSKNSTQTELQKKKRKKIICNVSSVAVFLSDSNFFLSCPSPLAVKHKVKKIGKHEAQQEKTYPWSWSMLIFWHASQNMQSQIRHELD